MKITHDLKIDLVRPEIVPPVAVVQGDTYTREIKIVLHANGEPWSLPNGHDIVIRYSKPDGTIGIYDTLPDGSVAWSSEGNTVSVMLAPQMLTCPGKVSAQVSIIVGSSIISTFTFFVIVEVDPSKGAVRSENYNNWRKAFLPQTTGAKVGQYLQISKVDDAGRITEMAPAENPAVEATNKAYEALRIANDVAQEMKDYSPSGTRSIAESAMRTASSRLVAPPSASVGQYFRVKEVDTNGVVTAVEAVDAHGGGNGSDSSQNTNQGSGLSSTATSLLISILQNALYTSDQSAIIAALKTALEESNSSDDGDSGNTGTEDPDNTYYTVLATTTNCTVESSATSIIEGGVYTALITPDDGYTIETVTVAMGGKDVTSTAYSNGSISISKVTGDIVVVATAMETPNDLVYSANWTFGKRQYSATGIQDNDAWTSSDWIDVTPGQVLTVTLLKTNEIDSTTYNWNGENLNFGAYFRDYSGAGVTATIPSTYMNLREDDDYPSSQEIVVPDGAVELCCCVPSMRSYFAGPSTVGFSCENLDGRPVWWSLVLSNGGAE